MLFPNQGGENQLNQTLLIIDAQQELMDGAQEGSAVFNKDVIIKNINKVIEDAKDANVPVVFVRDRDVAEGKAKDSKSTKKSMCQQA